MTDIPFSPRSIRVAEPMMTPLLTLPCRTRTAAADRRADDATAIGYDFRLTILVGEELFAGLGRTIAAAVADHHQGLAADEFGLGSIFFSENAEVKTNAISTISLYGFEEGFDFFDGEPNAEGIGFAHAIGVICPPFLFVSADEIVDFLFGSKFPGIYGFFFNCVHG
jgi:hypothetical protein